MKMGIYKVFGFIYAHLFRSLMKIQRKKNIYTI